MRRRMFLGLPAILSAPPALAQNDYGQPPIGQGEPAPPAAGRPPRAPGSRKMASRSYDELSPKQQRKARQAMARDGERDLPPEEARRRWDSTPERGRRAATHRLARANGRTRPAREPGQTAQ